MNLSVQMCIEDWSAITSTGRIGKNGALVLGGGM